jgi:hypothetical protein
MSVRWSYYEFLSEYEQVEAGNHCKRQVRYLVPTDMT